MATIINASNGSTSGLIQTGDASGILQLQTNNGTPALTLNTAQALGVGSSPAYGTAGQVLTSGGSGAAPSWTSPSAGAMTLISTQTANGTSSFLEWTGLSGYNNYLLLLNNIYPDATNPSSFQLQLGTSSAYITSSYYSSSFQNNSGNSAFSGHTMANEDRFYFSVDSISSTDLAGVSATAYISGLINNKPRFSTQTAFQSESVSCNFISQGYLTSTQTITKIKIFGDFGGGGGNILGGKASLYGIQS